MSNEQLIRSLIRASIQRAIQESVGAVVVLVMFAVMLAQSQVGSPRFYGCLLILVGTGFIAGVVWSFALSYQLLRTHSPDDLVFWREAFHSQARLLRLVPLWYCGPLVAGGLLIVAPTTPAEILLFLILAAGIALIFAGVTWLNRQAAAQLDHQASLLV